MNFNLSIPYITISFINANNNHKEFFDTLFFDTKVETKILFDVTITFRKITPTKEQYILENNCFRSGTDFYILDTKKNKCRVNFHTFTDKSIELEVEEEFDLYYLFTFLIEPLLIIWSAHHKLLFVHASGISKNNAVTIFPAWRNTGKTNTILEYCKNGYDFCGDDFCIINKTKVYLYPKSLNLFSYNLNAFPNVYKSLARSTVIRLKITLLVKKFLYNISQIMTGSISKVLYRISELAEVSTNIKVSPKQLNISVCNIGQLSEVILLQKSNAQKLVTKNSDTDRALQKIVQTIKYELKDFSELYLKYLYLFPNQANKYIDTFEDNYKKCLSTIKIQFKTRLVPKESV